MLSGRFRRHSLTTLAGVSSATVVASGHGLKDFGSMLSWNVLPTAIHTAGADLSHDIREGRRQL